MDAFLGNTTHVFISSLPNHGRMATRTLIRGGSSLFVLYDLERSKGQPILTDTLRATACALLHESISKRSHLCFHLSDTDFIGNVVNPILHSTGEFTTIHDVFRFFPAKSFDDVCWFAGALIKAIEEHPSVSFEKILIETDIVLHNFEDVVHTSTPSFELGPGPLCALIGDALDKMSRKRLRRPANKAVLRNMFYLVSECYAHPRSRSPSSPLPPDEPHLNTEQVHALLERCRAERAFALDSTPATVDWPLVYVTAGTASKDITTIEHSFSPATAGISNIRGIMKGAVVATTSVVGDTNLLSPLRSATAVEGKENLTLDQPAPFLRRKRAADYEEPDANAKRRKNTMKGTTAAVNQDAASDSKSDDQDDELDQPYDYATELHKMLTQHYLDKHANDTGEGSPGIDASRA